MSSLSAAQITSAYASTGPSIQVPHLPSLSTTLILAGDIVGVSIILWVFFGNTTIAILFNWLPLWTSLPLLLLLYWLFDLYPGVSVNPVAEIRRVALANASAFIFVSAILSFRHATVVSELLCLSTYIGASAAVLLLRTLIRRFGSQFAWWGYPVVLFGGGLAAATVLRRLTSQPHLGLRPVALVADHVAARELEVIPVFKSEYLDRIASIGIKHAIVVAPELSQSEFTDLMERSGDVFPHLILIPDTDSIWKAGAYTRDLTGILGIQVRNNLLDNGSRTIKRALDLVFSALLAILLLPLLVIISLLIVLESGFPVFYFQKRLGRGGRSFHMWKFRTMSQNSTVILDHCLAASSELRKEWEEYQKLREDPRITRVGRLLRRTSLDELPQLWNVIKGEMSLVGPRPYLAAQLARHQAAYSVYVKTTPGLTGLWQVSGRNRTTLAERIEFDTYYIRNWSVWMDIYLLAKTVGAVLTGDGAY